MSAPTVMSHTEAMVLAAGRQLRRVRARRADAYSAWQQLVEAENTAAARLAEAQAAHEASVNQTPEDGRAEIRRLSELRRSLIVSKGGAR